MSGFLCSMVGATFTVAATGQVLRAKKTITAVGNAQVDTAQSYFGGASLLLDGTDDRLEVTPTTTYDDFTVECWIRLANNSGTKNILSFGNESSGRVFFAVYNDRIYWDQYGVTSRHGNTSMSANTWYHLAWSRTGSTIKLFVNGVEQSMTTVSGSGTFPSGAVGNTNGIFIGTLSDGAIDFNGHIDEIRVSNSVRYTTGFTPSTTPFIDDSNTLFLMHANGTDATTVFEDDNGIGRSQNDFSVLGNARLSTARSKFGSSSAYFDGTGDYAIAANSITFADNQDFTWEFWVNEDVSQNCKYIGGQIQNDIFIGHDGGVFSNRLGVGVVSVGWYIDFGETLALDTWYHLCVQRSGDTVYGYINGVLKVTHTGALANWDWHWRKVVLGAETTGNTPFNGYLDEMRWSNIVRYATGGFTQPSAPFVNDANTVLLIHAEGTNNSTVITDDNAQLTITPAATSVNEGSSLTFNVSTVNTADQTLYYTATNSGDFATSSGSFSLVSNAGSFSLTPTADTTTEGAETFTASVRLGSTSGDIVATSSSITINDTSITAITLPSQTVKLGTPSAAAGYGDSGITDGVTNSSAGFTFSAWVYPTLTGHTGSQWCLMNLPNQDGGNASLYIAINDSGSLYFYRQVPSIEGAEYPELVSGAFPTANTWYHLVISGQANSTFVVYINGVQKTSLQYGGGISNNNFQLQILTAVRIGVADSAGYAAGKGDQIAQVWFDNTNVGITANLTKFYNNGYVEMGSEGTSSGLTRPLIYHTGNTTSSPAFHTSGGRTSASSGNYLTYNLLDNDVGTIVNGTS